MFIYKAYGDFRIRSMEAAREFIKNIYSGSTCMLKIDDKTALVLEKDSKSKFHVLIKQGDLKDIFNPMVEIAATDNDSYDLSVEQALYKYRKYINKGILSEN